MLRRLKPTRRVALYSAITVAIAASAFLANTGQQTSAETFFGGTTAEDIQAEELRVLKHIEGRIALGHEYYDGNDPRLSPERLRQKLSGGRDFWKKNELFWDVYWKRAVAEGEDTDGFTLLLGLTEKGRHSKGGNSQTMAATVLLNHVFDHLDELGYECHSTPGGTFSGIQYSTNTWRLTKKTRRGRDEITVTGEVFLSKCEGAALVMGRIHYKVRK